MLLVGDRTQVAERGMPANPIVKTLDLLKSGRAGLLPRVKGVALHTLTFERTKKTLHGRIIVTIANP